jgi:hypothetical protein
MALAGKMKLEIEQPLLDSRIRIYANLLFRGGNNHHTRHYAALSLGYDRTGDHLSR